MHVYESLLIFLNNAIEKQLCRIYNTKFVGLLMLLSFCRIAVYKAIYPSVGTLADVIAAVDHVSVTSVFKLTRFFKHLRLFKNLTIISQLNRKKGRRNVTVYTLMVIYCVLHIQIYN